MTNFSDMLSKAKAMQEKMKDAQEQIKKIEVEGEAGGNLVKVILSGDYELKSITISDAAKNRLLQLLKKDDKNNSFVRVGVESGGCSGLSYKLDFDDKKNADDEVVENNGITLIVNKKSFLYLVGTTLEFSDGLNGKGFVFNNPNASRTCGCGESFSL